MSSTFSVRFQDCRSLAPSKAAACTLKVPSHFIHSKGKPDFAPPRTDRETICDICAVCAKLSHPLRANPPDFDRLFRQLAEAIAPHARTLRRIFTPEAMPHFDEPRCTPKTADYPFAQFHCCYFFHRLAPLMFFAQSNAGRASLSAWRSAARVSEANLRKPLRRVLLAMR